MKYKHKCPICNRFANTKFKNVYFCNDDAKYVRKNKPKYVYKEKLLLTICQGVSIYRDIPVKLK